MDGMRGMRGMDGTEGKDPTPMGDPAETGRDARARGSGSPDPVSDETIGRWATAGAILAAIGASSCCILPVVLGAGGLSTVALAGTFESARPLLLAVTAVLLGVGFYTNYFRKPACEPGAACATPRPGLRRFSRGMLWLSTISVLALAFFPSYASVFAGGPVVDDPAFGSVASRRVELAVSGMTCEACAVSIQNELAAVPGVLHSEVDYPTGRAVVLVRADAPPGAQSLLAAVDRAGYSARVVGAEEAG